MISGYVGSARSWYREVASSAKTKRVQLSRVLTQLDAGYVLMETRLDRLARSTRNLLNMSTRSQEESRLLLACPDAWGDTTAYARLMLTVLGGLTSPPHRIRARNWSEPARAKVRGVKRRKPAPGRE